MSSSKIKVVYAVTETPNKTYIKMVPRNYTCEEFLKLISNSEKKYISLFIEESEIAHDDQLLDFYDTNPNTVFFASCTPDPPSKDFIHQTVNSKLTKSNKFSKSMYMPHISPVNPSQPPPIKNLGEGKVVKPSSKAKPPTPPTATPSPAKIPDLPEAVPSAAAKKDLSSSYYFCFTGGTKDMLLNGIPIELKDLSMTPNQCNDYLRSILQSSKVDIQNKQLLIYLPGGIPFKAGTLADIFSNKNLFNKKTKKFIYGILTRPLSDTILNGECKECCDVSNEERKILLSPLVDSTTRGLTDVACLLGYLSHDGANSNLLLRACVSVIHFPPLLTSINRIIDGNQVTGREIVAVCSTFYTYFRSIVPASCKDNQVFEYLLRLCNLISNYSDPPQRLPLMTINLDPRAHPTKFLTKLNLGPVVYFWKIESAESAVSSDIKIKDKDIENAYNYSTFTPIDPLSIRVVIGCSIIKGKDHEFLYLSQSPIIDTDNQIIVEIINPLTGKIQSKDINKFAKEQGNTSSNQISNVDQIKQIIMVNFDQSKFMKHDLSGIFMSSQSYREDRYSMACQYLTTFSNRIYGYHYPCIIGLMSFSDSSKVKIPLSPPISNFSDIGLKQGLQTSTPHLWDSIYASYSEIIKFKKENRGFGIYKNATSRIFVISCGDDISSETSVVELTKELIKNKIILDSIIISSKESCKMLCAVSHATGGFSFRPKNILDGLSIIDKGAFLNYDERKPRLDPLIPGDRSTTPNRIKPEQITSEFLQNAAKSAFFDREIVNKELTQAASKQHIATPSHVCAANRDSVVPSFRQRRIMNELSIAERVSDPDMKIFTFQSNLDRWIVLLKGPEGTLYAGKWWYLYVTFPELYPAVPPIFRFISVPFHLNVSSEGRICLNVIYEGYKTSKRVISVIQEIKELFSKPNLESAVQVYAYDLYLNDRDNYNAIALASTEEYGKNDYNEYLDGSFICNTVPDDSTWYFIDDLRE